MNSTMNSKTTANVTVAVATTSKVLASIDSIPETISAPMARLAAAEGNASKALDKQFEALRQHYDAADIAVGKSIKTCAYRKGVATALAALQPLTGWSDATCRQYASAFFGCLAADQTFDRNFRSDTAGGKTTDDVVLLQQYIRKALKKAQELQHKHHEHLAKTAKLFGVSLD